MTHIPHRLYKEEILDTYIYIYIYVSPNDLKSNLVSIFEWWTHDITYGIRVDFGPQP